MEVYKPVATCNSKINLVALDYFFFNSCFAVANQMNIKDFAL